MKRVDFNFVELSQSLYFFRYSDKKAYGQSKLANILHAKELARRLKVNGVAIEQLAFNFEYQFCLISN